MAAAVALSFCFDDPAAPTTNSAPNALISRRAQRVVLALGPWVTSVAIVILGAMNVRSPMPGSLTTTTPFARLVLEAATMAVVGLAIAAYIAKRWDEQPGRIAAPALIGLYALSWALPYPLRPWSVPGLSGWETSLVWWWVTVGVGMAVAALFSWDAREQTWRRVLRPSRTRGAARHRESQATSTPESG